MNRPLCPIACFSAVAPAANRCYQLIAMPQLLVRDVPRDVVDALRRRAAGHGRSAEAEHRAILEITLKAGRSGFARRARLLRENTQGRIQGESAEIIRQDRDRP